MNSFVFHDFQYSVATFSIRNKTEEESIFFRSKMFAGGTNSGKYLSRGTLIKCYVVGKKESP